jgi:DNA-directed RNA polymerase specialized sigma subunit
VEPDVDGAIDLQSRKDELLESLSALPPRLLRVVTLLHYRSMPLASVAAELGLTVSRIRQLNREALDLLRLELE